MRNKNRRCRPPLPNPNHFSPACFHMRERESAEWWRIEMWFCQVPFASTRAARATEPASSRPSPQHLIFSFHSCCHCFHLDFGVVLLSFSSIYLSVLTAQMCRSCTGCATRQPCESMSLTRSQQALLNQQFWHPV
jgi:hypothetical protein